MASSAPEVSGGMGSGEAQVFQERLHPMLVFGAQQDARRAQQDANQQKNQQAQQQKRNADVQKLVDENMGTPGWFQKENSVNELSSVRSNTEKFAFENPMSGINEISSATREEKSKAQGRIAKRDELGKEIEFIRSDLNNPRATLDNQWVNSQVNRFYDEDVDNIPRGSIVGLKNHPRAYDADRGIIKSVDEIKNQVEYTGTGQPQDIGYGIQIEGNSKKLRFKTDANGQIANETVDFVLDSDPAISQRVRWDVARQMSGVPDDSYASPEEMGKIDAMYKKIQYSNDPSVVSKVRGKVRQTLNALQQTQNIDRLKVQNYPASKGNEPTPEDVTNRMVKINTIKNSLKEFGPGAQVGTKTQNYLAELRGVSKFNGMPVTNIEMIPGELNPKGGFNKPSQLKITMKSGTESGDVLEHIEYIKSTDPKFEEVLNNLYNSTSSTTKEKKITGDKLRGTTPYLDEDESNLDEEDEGFLDE